MGCYLRQYLIANEDGDRNQMISSSMREDLLMMHASRKTSEDDRKCDVVSSQLTDVVIGSKWCELAWAVDV